MNSTPHRRLANDESGFALAATLIVLVTMSVLVFAIANGAMTSIRASTMEFQTSKAYYAAEAGAEYAMAQLETALDDGAVTPEELAAISPPTIEGFSFDSFFVGKVGDVDVKTITDGHFAGLYALTQNLEIHSEAVDAIGNSAASIISVEAQAIPIFQFGVFYEKDLEITNGPAMEFAGWVHSNGNIYLSSNNAWYRDIVTTPNKLFHDRKDAHSVLFGVYVNDAVANEVQLDFDSRSHPDPSAFMAQSNAKFDNRVKTDAYEVDSLNVPLPTGVDPLEIIQPRQTTDDALERKAKFSWKADWYITVNLDAPGDVCATMVSVRTGQDVPSAADCTDDGLFEMKWDAFYEDREQRHVDVFEIDIEALGDWIDDAPGQRASRIMHVTFVGTGLLNDTFGDGTHPMVRVVEGEELWGPFTLASDRGIYVQGDYNTDNWQPAALAGDAITWLSNACDDSDNEVGEGLNDASNTTVNAAVLVGHSATPCDHEDGGCSGGAYGGGLENFPRFLERWSGRTLTYQGSLVSMFVSQYSVGQWQYGDPIYQAPLRDWQFDTRFEDPTKLPPGTPVVGYVIRTAYRPAPAY